MKCLFATFAHRMHRKPISCQRGSEIGLFAGKRCRVVMQNAHNGDFAQTRQGDAALHNQARRLRRAAPPGYIKRPAPRRPSPTGNVKVTNQKCLLYRLRGAGGTPRSDAKKGASEYPLPPSPPTPSPSFRALTRDILPSGRLDGKSASGGTLVVEAAAKVGKSAHFLAALTKNPLQKAFWMSMRHYAEK